MGWGEGGGRGGDVRGEGDGAGGWGGGALSWCLQERVESGLKTVQ